ncbi:SAM-dependent methyltransferase [Okibacterium sp. HSC-33S16]|uniref:class I SAM-dependent methyltransferase n=1 Tax=Okibacterium sp. HSC-33S16 TaxID=2910965 RepID=UPI0020A14220|nr:methyltransferase domain-containing protein [Okibacterium sp. HSC-33S16]MCP2030434.1 SAM-dependent methyltransferase [Okibacterium sp. HSC-33S16]
MIENSFPTPQSVNPRAASVTSLDGADEPHAVSINPRDGEWLDANRAQWDERVPLHLASDFYDQSALRAGDGRLTPIDEAELQGLFPGDDGRFRLDGKRVLHLQCHFGADTLTIAQRGASVIGLDFSPPAIRAARALAADVGLAERTRFLIANLYDARHALPEPDSFDVVFTTWGTIGWLPDVAEWARIIEWFLAPGGTLYFADGHPAAMVFDSTSSPSAPLPEFAYPYGDRNPLILDQADDYADGDAVLTHTRSWEWAHPTSEIVGALLEAGLQIDKLGEHFEVPWKMFDQLVPTGDGMFGWPDGTPWLPLALEVVASKPGGER